MWLLNALLFRHHAIVYLSIYQTAAVNINLKYNTDELRT